VLLTVVDNKHELIKIHTYWPDVKLLIRLKTEDSHSLIGFSTKFGANERVAIQLFESAKALNLNLIGYTFHVGTGCYNINAFTHSLVLARRLYDIAKSSKYDFKFTMLDIGGGFPGVDEQGKPTFSEMAEQINQTLDTFFSENEVTFFVCMLI
jgi:ornithine decarboxylase